MPQNVFERIAAAGFSAPAHAELGRAIVGALATNPDLIAKGQNEYLRAIAAILPDELAPLLREIAVTPLPVSDQAGVAAYAEGVMMRALDVVLNREKNNLLAALRRIDPSQSPAEYREISAQLIQIEAQRRSLR